MPGERYAMASVARWQHAVEHVDAARDRLQEIFGRADAHQVAGTIGGKRRRGFVDHSAHDLTRFADRKAPDGVSLKTDIGERPHALGAQLRIVAALHDAKQRVTVTRPALLFECAL